MASTRAAVCIEVGLSCPLGSEVRDCMYSPLVVMTTRPRCYHRCNVHPYGARGLMITYVRKCQSLLAGILTASLVLDGRPLAVRSLALDPVPTTVMRVDRGNGRGDWTAVEDEALMQVREAIGEWLALTSEELDQEGLAEDQPEQQPLVLQSIVAMAIALVVCQLVWGGGDDGIAQAARRIGQDFMEAVRLAADPNNAWI
jgi:hypothetical protein